MTDFHDIKKYNGFQKAVASLKLKFANAEISKLTGHSKANVSKYLNGKLEPSENFYRDFQKSFEINISDFITNKYAVKDQGETDIVADKPTGYYFPEVSASAGLENEINNDELTRIPVTIPGWGDDVAFINVYGDSMYPKYNAGEIIGVKSVEFTYLNYGYPYVVVLRNGDVYIKIIQPGSDKDHLSLESTNQFYQPKEFHLENIKSFYSIKGVIKKEMI